MWTTTINWVDKATDPLIIVTSGEPAVTALHGFWRLVYADSRYFFQQDQVLNIIIERTP